MPERKARQIEGQSNGTPSPKSSKNATVKDAVESFLIAKSKENLASDTLYRHEHIMELFLDFCERQGIMFIRDVTVDQLNQWQNEWTLVAPQAKNTRKEKVRNFFKYCVVNGNSEYLFWSGKTSHEDAPSYFHKMYRRVFKAAGIDGSSHDFRHTYAVELLKAGVDIRKVSKALGHSSLQVTERYYSKWNKAQQDIMDDEIERALAKAGKR